MTVDHPENCRGVARAGATSKNALQPVYVIVTPARDEEKNLPDTIVAVSGQTIPPSQWIIVDDGSTDQTGKQADEAARQYPWISVVHRIDRGKRKAGGGVMEAFYAGLEVLTVPSWEFLIKLDGDLSFEPDYFERCLARFAADPKLGVGGGMICRSVAGKLVSESPGDPPFHVRGATKIYRRSCWDAIGGLLLAPGWDTVDELKANMLGWTTRTFPDVTLHHHRFTGSADGKWRNLVKFGLANYVAGYHPLFMAAKCLSRMRQRPFLLGSAAMLWGFTKGYLIRAPRIEDSNLRQFVRRQQLNRLLNRPSLWSGTIGESLNA